MERVATAPAEVESLVPLVQSELEPVEPHGDVLTDDHAPVEWLTDRMIVDFVSRGGELDEDHLPTAAEVIPRSRGRRAPPDRPPDEHARGGSRPRWRRASTGSSWT